MKPTPEKISAELGEKLRGDVFVDSLHRAAYSRDASIYQILPACVIAPRGESDVVTVVNYARENGIPITARGSGTGVAGESLSTGIVLDMRRYMNNILGYNEDLGIVICQPGVVLGNLNDYLAEFGRKIGPDPSSGNRATVAGCVANNATGAHSLKYGYMADHVEALEAVLADGSVVEFNNDLTPAKTEQEKVRAIADKVLNLLKDKQDLIADVQPKSGRNRCGYNIARIYHDEKIDMAKLLAGSEGTLAVFTRISLKTVPLPKAKALLQLEFDSLDKMAKAVPKIVETGASACELMDKKLMEMAKQAFPHYHDIFPTDAAAILLIEQMGDNESQVRDKIQTTDSAVGDLASGRQSFFEEQQQQRLWKSRKDAVPLVGREKGRKRPIPFIEDTAVDINRLADYLAGIEKISSKYEFSMSFYGHAGDGELHLRPHLDLSESGDVEKMKSIAADVFSLVLSLGGSISGEHAIGLVRAGFTEQQYGSEYYQILKTIKKIFDPEGILNPGKIINASENVMTEELKSSHKFDSERLKSELFLGENELALEIDQCTGCGLCLAETADIRMCPVFRALGDELGSSRAKANVLRFWATGELDEKDFASDEFRHFLDLCVHCKSCSLQCPSGVNVSKLVMAARTKFAEHKRLSLAEKILSRNRYLSKIGSSISDLANAAAQNKALGWVLDKTAGIDRRRKMPAFEKGSFLEIGQKYLSTIAPAEEPIEKIAFFLDTYANFHDHGLAEAVLKVLAYNDIEVILPEQLPAPLPAIVYGDIVPARKELEFNVEHLAKAVKDGYRIICSEPSAALCLKDDLQYFVKGSDAELISENTFELMSFLLDLFKDDKLKPAVKSISRTFVYHCPCHLMGLGRQGTTIELLEGLCGVQVKDLVAGCCGIAGTYGMKKSGYELSQQISQRLTDALEKAETKNILTECGMCKMQIEHISDCVVEHPIKVIAAAYGLAVD